LDNDGYLDQKEIQQACKTTGYSDNYDEIRATLKDVSTNAAGKIDVEEFIEVKYFFFFKYR
jgi:plastin-1